MESEWTECSLWPRSKRSSTQSWRRRKQQLRDSSKARQSKSKRMKTLGNQIGRLVVVLLCCGWAFAGTFTAFGPQSYVRGNGKPVAVSNSFSILNPNTQYTLRVEAARMDEDHDQDSDDGDPRAVCIECWDSESRSYC